MDTGILIVDYGMGNLRSVEKAFEHIGAPARLTSDPAEVEKARAIVLPGVGAFKSAYEELVQRRLRDVIVNKVNGGTPYLGICLGLQLLFDNSDEDGPSPGLGLMRGNNVRFPQELKCPHMGWNQINIVKNSPLTEGIASGSYFYFVHSFYPVPENGAALAATCEYGSEFCAVVAKDNVFATQFHPEKSQENGLKLLSNFARFVQANG